MKMGIGCHWGGDEMSVLADVVPISDLRHKQNEVIGRLVHGPVILTQRGRGAAVLMSMERWKAFERQSAYLAEAMEDAEDIRVANEIEARIARGAERTYSHEEVWAEIDALEAQGALSA
jgi:prevent-host-death family protein